MYISGLKCLLLNAAKQLVAKRHGNGTAIEVYILEWLFLCINFLEERVEGREIQTKMAKIGVLC